MKISFIAGMSVRSGITQSDNNDQNTAIAAFITSPTSW